MSTCQVVVVLDNPGGGVNTVRLKLVCESRDATPNGKALRVQQSPTEGNPPESAASPVPYGGASAEDGFPVAGIWRRRPSFSQGETLTLLRR